MDLRRLWTSNDTEERPILVALLALSRASKYIRQLIYGRAYLQLVVIPVRIRQFPKSAVDSLILVTKDTRPDLTRVGKRIDGIRQIILLSGGSKSYIATQASEPRSQLILR